jgi:hypothetical protein
VNAEHEARLHGDAQLGDRLAQRLRTLCKHLREPRVCERSPERLLVG